MGELLCNHGDLSSDPQWPHKNLGMMPGAPALGQSSESRGSLAGQSSLMQGERESLSQKIDWRGNWK